MSHVSKGLFKIKSFVLTVKDLVILQIIVLRGKFLLPQLIKINALFAMIPSCFEAPTKVGSRKIQGTRIPNCKQFFYATDGKKKDLFFKTKKKM